MKIFASTDANPNLSPNLTRHDPIPNINVRPANDHLLE